MIAWFLAAAHLLADMRYWPPGENARESGPFSTAYHCWEMCSLSKSQTMIVPSADPVAAHLLSVDMAIGETSKLECPACTAK